jgi:hypothetical protein
VRGKGYWGEETKENRGKVEQAARDGCVEGRKTVG